MITTEEYIPDPQSDIIEAVPEKRDDYVVHDVPATIPSNRKEVVLYRSYQLVWFFFGVIETLLLFRFVLKLIGASTISGFTDFVYALSFPFANPFFGTLPTSVSGSSVVEWSTLIALVVYIVLAYGIIEVIHLLTPVADNKRQYVTKRTRYAI